MRLAIVESRKGFPAPNPHVGCVIVKDGKVIGRGHHDYAGGPHAEVVALKKAGDSARGADVYVTLQPCNHTGRTPPCSQALIAAGVASVTVACKDPNARSGGGIEVLSHAGIRVSVGLLEEEAKTANERFLVAMERGWPFVEAKVAISLDGRVALSNGESKWITNEMSREKGHWLRAQCGAVLVGRKTVERDDPHLTARIRGVKNQPVRIIFDPNSVLNRRERVFDGDAPTWHIVKHPLHENQLRAPMRDEHFDLPALLKELFDRGLTSVLVEGGPITLGHLLRQNLIDKLHVFLAAKALGNGPSWMQEQIVHIADAPQFLLDHAEKLNSDLWLSYRPNSR